MANVKISQLPSGTPDSSSYLAIDNGTTTSKVATSYFATADTDAVSGNLAKFDSSGNPIDSGHAESYFATASSVPSTTDAILALFPKSAPSHNAIYRGKDLTDIYTIEQLSAKVADGSFDDLYIGDYITKSVTINGTAYSVNWVFADFDYFIKNGDTETTDHHILMIPSAEIYTAQMNTSNTTANGYVGSKMWTTQMPYCATGIKSAFGNGHVLSHRELLGNAMTSSTASMAGAGYTGATTLWAWTDVTANIPNEVMVYGCHPFSSSAMDIGNRKRQLSLFRLSESAITTRANWWLSAVASSTYFTFVHGDGLAHHGNASASCGVRPYFLFY